MTDKQFNRDLKLVIVVIKRLHKLFPQLTMPELIKKLAEGFKVIKN